MTYPTTCINVGLINWPLRSDHLHRKSSLHGWFCLLDTVSQLDIITRYSRVYHPELENILLTTSRRCHYYYYHTCNSNNGLNTLQFLMITVIQGNILWCILSSSYLKTRRWISSVKNTSSVQWWLAIKFKNLRKIIRIASQWAFGRDIFSDISRPSCFQLYFTSGLRILFVAV